MKTYIPLVCAACLLIVACEMPQNEPDAGVDQQEVRQAIEAQNARLEGFIENQQFDSLGTLYTAGGQLMGPNAPTATGDDIVQAFAGFGEMGIASIDLQTNEVEAAEDFAYEVGSYTLMGEDGSELDDGKYIVIWKMEDGEWKLHRDIFNSNQPPLGLGETSEQPAEQP